MGRRVIFDFDDAIFQLHTTDANRRYGWLKFPGKTATICRLSRHVVVGNEYLAEYARKYNQHVTIIPSSVDVDRYRPDNEERDHTKTVIGWMGSSTSQTHLEMAAPVLRELVQLPNVELRVVSDREPVLPGVRFVWSPWSAEKEIEELSHFDIGIMPMPDDAFARGKSAMKALLYMSMGIPTICSPVGANRDVIQHDENGLLATSPEEWIAAVKRLTSDRALRATLGARGRRTVEEGYSMTHCAELFEGVVRSVITDRRSAVNHRRPAVTDRRATASGNQSDS
jgi:glycosyltransferase involved in cell wall biosynthesis